MEFEYRYRGPTTVESSGARTDVSLAPDVLREPTYFSGALRSPVPFREAMSALHDVVAGDFTARAPRDKSAYKAWAQQEEDRLIQEAVARRAGLDAQLATLRRQLGALHRGRSERWAPFYKARERYFKYLFFRDYSAWLVLDPVITVHPDQLFFECLSKDESAYGKLSVDLDAFSDVGEHACGTTNVDYSLGLYDAFQKMRSYKETRFEIDRAGFDVDTQGEDLFTEVKIDLPDSWVHGFLQVSSAMTLGAQVARLHPMDLHNICFVLRRKRETHGPRSLRWRLKPGEPISVVVDPWDTVVPCPRSIFLGDQEQEVRTWGRRRLFMLERLIPVAESFDVHLLGYGMPSFFVAKLPGMTFTLGLSGWSANDWSTQGQFDLLAPRQQVDTGTAARVFQALSDVHAASTAALAKACALDDAVVMGALQSYTQAGRVLYDLDDKVWRKRELSRVPLEPSALRFSSEREREAHTLVQQKRVSLRQEEQQQQRTCLRGDVGDRGKHLRVEAVIDADERLVEASCSCNFFQQNALRKGPCAHVLALRMMRGDAQRRLFGIW